MTILKRISPASAFKVGFICYAFLGLVLGALCTLVALGAFPLAHAAHSMFLGKFVGVFAVLVCPIVYGLFGGVSALIGAFIYNLASGWVGGLEVEIS
jgi:hypothetical protein